MFIRITGDAICFFTASLRFGGVEIHKYKYIHMDAYTKWQ